MSVIPERILHRAIVSGIRSIREDSRLLSSLFKNLDQDELQDIRDFLVNNTIDFSINFPRKSPTSPAMILMLKTEKEGSTFLGNFGGMSPFYGLPEQGNTIDTLSGHAGTISNMDGLPEKILGPLNVSSASGSSLVFDDSSLDEVEAYVEEVKGTTPSCPTLYVIDGAGKGKKYTIIRLTKNSLDTEGTFDPQLDSSSIVEIREANSPGLIGEPERVFSEDAVLKRHTVNYISQYQLNILASSSEEVIYLYYIVKAVLLSHTTFLEEQGLLNFSMGGSDLAPRSEYLPSEVFLRVLNLNFEYSFDAVSEVQDAFSSIDTTLFLDDINEESGRIDFSTPI